MADTPISAFTELVAADVEPDDVLPVVDVHDLTQAPTGTTKKVTIASLFTDPTFAGTATADAFSGDLNASDLVSGTVPAARITGTGVLDTGSITSGFGSIDVGTDPISGGIVTGTRLKVAGGTPTVATSTGTSVSVTGNDAAGVVTFNWSGSTITAGTKLATITFSGAFSSTPTAVYLTLQRGLGRAYPTLSFTNLTTAGFDVYTETDIGTSTQVVFGFLVIG